MRARRIVLGVATAGLTVALQSGAWADPNLDPSKPGLGPPAGRTEHTSCERFGQSISSSAQAPGPWGQVVSEAAQNESGQLQHDDFCEPRS